MPRPRGPAPSRRWQARTPIRMYSAAVRFNLTAYADFCVAYLWNPSTTRTVQVRAVSLSYVTALATAMQMKVVRTSTLGNWGTAVAAVQQNDYSYGATAPSGATVYTQAAPPHATVVSSAAPIVSQGWGSTADMVGTSTLWSFPEPIRVPPSTGLGFMYNNATNIGGFQGDFTCWWNE